MTAGCSSRVRSDRNARSRRRSTTLRTTTISRSSSAVGTPPTASPASTRIAGHEEAADVRDEPRSKHEHGKRPGERHADQGQDDEAHDRVHGGDHGRPAHVPAGSAHGLLAGVPDPVALPAAKPCEPDVPGLVPVEKQIEGQEEPEHHDGPGFDERIDDRRRLLRQPSLDLLDDLRRASRPRRRAGWRRRAPRSTARARVEVLRQIDQERDQREGDQKERAARRSGPRRRAFRRRPSRRPSRALAAARRTVRASRPR